MGMSTHIVGFKSKDSDLYKKHEAVLRACIDAKITELPKETVDFFGDCAVEEYILEEHLEVKLGDCVSEYNADMQDGYEIKVKDIPKGVDVIRVYNSY